MSRHLEVEIKKLKKKLLSLTAQVEQSVQLAVSAIKDTDVTIAQKVVDGDNLIDEKEVELEEDCLKILALHQPVAIDLRFIIGVLKINNDLERIGDLSVNIAERILFLKNKCPQIDNPFDYQIMAQKAYSMLHRSIESLINMDKELAKQVLSDDHEIDELNKEMYFKTFDRIKQDPDKVASHIQYLSVSKNLERIADYTTNIAEDVIYMIDGEIVRHNPDIN